MARGEIDGGEGIGGPGIRLTRMLPGGPFWRPVNVNQLLFAFKKDGTVT